MGLETFLRQLQEESLSTYQSSEWVMGFEKFLGEVYRNPYIHLRSAPQYVLEMLEFYGTRVSTRVGQEASRFKVYDQARSAGAEALVGQERAQAELFGYIKSFARKGRADKMVLLHGPNGSGKTTIIECLCRGLEDFSQTPQGALYRFNWIFIDREGKLDRIGFDNEIDEGTPSRSYSELEEKDIGARICCELRDSPLLLIPRDKRKAIIDEAIARCDIPPRPEYSFGSLLDGELCQKCRRIFDSLLSAYHGDWKRVVQHIQVERYSVSKRYRTGAVSIEPQGNMDASVRPVHSEHHWSLPAILRNVTLYEPVGDIIDANHGILEYSDFLKRPVESSKYLLTTCERGTVNLPHFMAYLNLMILGTTNEKQLNLFKRSSDFSSFKGRIELVPVPYILMHSKEIDIYNRHINSFSRDRHVTPHTARIAAIWAVLTRLRKPIASRYTGLLASVVSTLTPIEKAKLYDHGETPARLRDEEKKILLANVLTLRREYDEEEGEFEGIFGAEYEGRRGASPREMMAMLSRAAENQKFRCLTPMAVFDAMAELCKETSLYEFLRFPSDEGYNDVRKFLDDVKEEYIHLVTEEVFDSISLIDEGEYKRLFIEYFRHVKAFSSREKIYNTTTNSYEPPNHELLHSIEKLLKFSESPEIFRSNIMTRIGARSLESPRGKIDYHDLFPGILQALRENFYRERNRLLTLIEEDILKYDSEDFALLSPEDQKRVKEVLAKMQAKYGYCQSCAKDVIAYVLRTCRDR